MKILIQILISTLPTIALFLENRDANKTGTDDRAAQALKAAGVAFAAFLASDKKGVIRALQSVIAALQTLISDLENGQELPKL